MQKLKGHNEVMNSSKIKVLFVLPDLAGGGAERVTLDLIKTINKDKFEVTLFLLRNCGEYLNDLPHNFQYKYGINGKKSFIKHYFIIMKRLVNATKNVDIVVGSLELKGHLFSTIAANKCNKPIIGWLHKHLGYYLQGLPYIKKFCYKNITKALYKRMDKVVTVSKDANDVLLSLFPFLREKFTYIYNPIDEQKIKILANEKLPEWFNNLPSEPVILSVGRLEYQKGFDILIKSFSSIVKKGYSGTLLILGEGSQKEQLRKIIDTENLHSRVILPGFINPYPIIKQSDLFVLSSRYEGLPTVLIEALVLDKKIIATDCPAGPREILKNGKYGTLVTTENTQELAEALEQFFKWHNDKSNENHFTQIEQKQKIEDFNKFKVCDNWQKVISSTLCKGEY